MGVLLLCRDGVGIFYHPNWLGSRCVSSVLWGLLIFLCYFYSVCFHSKTLHSVFVAAFGTNQWCRMRCNSIKHLRTKLCVGIFIYPFLEFIASNNSQIYSGNIFFDNHQWHFHQDNPPVHNSILVTDYLSKMGIKTVPPRPYSPELAPCDFWLFPKLRGCCYETIEEVKETVMKVIDAHIRGLWWGLPEVVGTVQKVHCSQRRLLRRGLEFHVCTINKSAHTKKAGNLSYAPCTETL